MKEQINADLLIFFLQTDIGCNTPVCLIYYISEMDDLKMSRDNLMLS